MESIGVFYFSGTGNTEIIANMITEQFREKQLDVDLIKIEDILKNKKDVSIEKYDLIGIGSQVIGYSTPKLVMKFIKILPKQKDKKVFLFRTAGGVAPINFNVSKSSIRRLKSKGYDVYYERLFSLCSNWVKKFDDEIVHGLYQACQRKIGLMCQELIDGERKFYKTGLGLRIKMGLISRFSSIFISLIGRDLYVNSSCTKCGHCIHNCPAQNIDDSGYKIKFKKSCNSCLRCIYSCPKQAIKFKHLKFIPVTGGYNINETLAKLNNEQKSDHGFVPQFYENYLTDDNL